MHHRRIILLAASLVFAAPAQSDEPQRGTLILEYENDLFGGEDRYYTNGVRLTWISPDDRVPAWIRRGAGIVPFFADQGDLKLSYSLGQNIYTPNDIKTATPPTDDHPYAGWLYGSIGLGSETPTRLDRLQLNLGVVGPASLAERTQREIHRLVGSSVPQGWDTQLSNEPTLMLTYDRQWLAWRGGDNSSGWGWDVTPSIGGAAGNVFTQLNSGLTLRFGHTMPADWGPPRIGPTLPGSGLFRPRGDFGWYLFVSADGRMVARNLFLDGNTFTDSRSVDKRHLVGELQFGGVMNVGRRFRLTYTHVLSTRAFSGQRGDSSEFGSLSASLLL